MPDIDLRLHKDMLVLSAPVLPALQRLGVDVERDAELTLLLEPDTYEDFYKMEAIAGAQCMVAGTGSFTSARLTRVRMEERAADLVRLSLEAVSSVKPQHVLAEIGPCGLPLDPSSKASLNENKDQYARAGRLYADAVIDAFFLNGFSNVVDLKCALMGLRQVSDCAVFASVDVTSDGMLVDGRGTLEEALAVMEEYEASAAGFSTAAGQREAVALAERAAQATVLPLIVQLEVGERNPRQQGPTAQNPYYSPDMMLPAADALRSAGVQFLRAVGDATPAYTGALVAASMGLDVARSFPEEEGSDGKGALEVERENAAELTADALADFVASARRRVSEALNGNLKIVEEDGPAVDLPLSGEEVADDASDEGAGRA